MNTGRTIKNRKAERIPGLGPGFVPGLIVMGFLGLMGFVSIVRAEMAFQVLYKFFPANSNGEQPQTRLVEKDGSFYGTSLGPPSGFGNIFKFTPGVGVSNIATFDSSNGYKPVGGLTLGNDGNFYGVTEGNNYAQTQSSKGTVFRLTPDGVITTLACFAGTNGASPIANMVLGSDGNLYGTTAAGGTNGLGTIFKVTTNGALTSLASFNTGTGDYPLFCSLLEASNGCFYGTTVRDGVGDCGTIFKITSSGEFTTVLYFNGTNGKWPLGLTLGGDHNFYGTTVLGGQFGMGTVFRLTPNGALTTVASFNGTNGAEPYAPLTLGRDGQFYASTAYRTVSGIRTFGTVFQASTNGTITTLACVDGTNGINPTAIIIPGSDGNLYGTISDINWEAAADGNVGSLFRIVPQPTINSITRSNNNLVLSWSAISNGAYRLENKTSIGSPAWIPISSNITAGGTNVSFQLPFADVPERYFRVVLLP